MEVVAVLGLGDKFEYKVGTSIYTVEATEHDIRILKPHKIVKKGIYTPKDLGFYLHGIKQINVGLCTHNISWTSHMKEKPNGFIRNLLGIPAKKYEVLGNKIRSTTDYDRFNWDSSLGHVNPLDGENPDQFCIRDGRYVYESDGVPSEIILHEYAHTIAGCSHMHDKVWEEACKSLGITQPRPGYPDHITPLHYTQI